MERSLHPLEDSDAANEVAWLAQAQVLHEAILAFNAQANIDRELAERVLALTQPQSVAIALAKRAERLAFENPLTEADTTRAPDNKDED
jgi:hypothetical protein